MNKYLRLFRLGNCVMGIIGIITGAFIAVGFDILDHLVPIAIACAVVVVFMAGGNALNDYIDREIDKTAHPDRPVPRGEITPIAARNLGIAAMLASVLLSLLLFNPLATVMVIICAVFMVLYETTFKQRGFIGNLTIAGLTAMIFVVGGTVVNSTESTILFGIMAFLVNVGREISKDIEDMESDEGRRTLPMSIGPRKAAAVASAAFIIGPILSIIPFITGELGPFYLLVLVADAMFLYCSYIVFTSAHSAQKYAKIAMFIALFAFIFGVI